ncbi:MAG: hypothetical protein V4467_04375 [Patescibacteria group bacterium]
MKNYVERVFSNWPKLKKIIAIALIVLGFLALVTPLTPGSWLVFVGLELLGVDLLFWKKIKEWFKNGNRGHF